MRTRQLTWLVAILLTVFALPAAAGARVVNFAEVDRVEVVCRGEQPAVERRASRAFPADQNRADRNNAAPLPRELRISPWLFSYSRFQRPPPSLSFA